MECHGPNDWTRITADGKFDESVGSLPTIQRVDERLVWSEQIVKSYDRSQPIACAHCDDLIIPKRLVGPW